MDWALIRNMFWNIKSIVIFLFNCYIYIYIYIYIYGVTVEVRKSCNARRTLLNWSVGFSRKKPPFLARTFLLLLSYVINICVYILKYSPEEAARGKEVHRKSWMPGNWSRFRRISIMGLFEEDVPFAGGGGIYKEWRVEGKAGWIAEYITYCACRGKHSLVDIYVNCHEPRRQACSVWNRFC